MVLREIFRVPMGAFDEYRALCFKQPRAMNFLMMNMILISFIFFGKGLEKLSVAGNQAQAYESSRRVRRFFVPYFLCNYEWRFPENKWS